MRAGATIQGTRHHPLEDLSGHDEEFDTDRAIAEMPEPIHEPLKHVYLGRGTME
jgi:hypothetical protein